MFIVVKGRTMQGVSVVEGQVDTSADLPDDVGEGSIFYASHEGKFYTCDSAGDWYDDEGNAAT